MNEIKLSDDQINKLVQELQGTIDNFSQTVEELFGVDGDNLDMETLSKFDSELFNCPVCGWWYEIGEADEYNGESMCQSCAEDEAEDEREDDDE